MSERRRTIGNATSLNGTGLHTGAEASVTLGPSKVGRGITFERTDLEERKTTQASADNVVEVDRRISIGSEDARIETVEHVLAAIAAHGIDDILIEVNGPEVPAVDGSAAPFFEALSDAGVVEAEGNPDYHRIRTPFTVRDGDSSYVVAPGDSLRLTCTIESDHPAIGAQSVCVQVTPESFEASLAGARTFGLLSEADELRSKGLALGASESNVIALSEDDVVGELRWPDEFVRHKTVDLLGDLALLGGRFSGEIVAHRPGHKGNVALVQAIRRVAGFKVPPVMGIQDILGVIPHRYPMLLVDRIVEVETGKRVVGIKNVTVNEPFFQGHFPEHPIMPGVLIIEAMGQVGGMLLMGAVDNPEDKVVYFMAINDVKFRRPVVPGDQIRFELEMLHFRGRNCRMRGVGYVDGDRVAEAEMMARVIDK